MISATVTRMEGAQDGLRFGTVHYSNGDCAGFRYDRLSGNVTIVRDDDATMAQRFHRITDEHRAAATLAVRAKVPPIEGVGL